MPSGHLAVAPPSPLPLASRSAPRSRRRAHPPPVAAGCIRSERPWLTTQELDPPSLRPLTLLQRPALLALASHMRPFSWPLFSSAAVAHPRVYTPMAEERTTLRHLRHRRRSVLGMGWPPCPDGSQIVNCQSSISAATSRVGLVLPPSPLNNRYLQILRCLQHLQSRGGSALGVGTPRPGGLQIVKRKCWIHQCTSDDLRCSSHVRLVPPPSSTSLKSSKSTGLGIEDGLASYRHNLQHMQKDGRATTNTKTRKQRICPREYDNSTQMVPRFERVRGNVGRHLGWVWFSHRVRLLILDKYLPVMFRPTQLEVGLMGQFMDIPILRCDVGSLVGWLSVVPGVSFLRFHLSIPNSNIVFVVVAFV